MVGAIVRKELREVWPFAAVALAVSVVSLIRLTGKLSPLLTGPMDWLPGMDAGPADVPFVDDYFLEYYALIGTALALTLGFRQSAWEPSQGTALYLLHLPLGRPTLFVTKLLTGTVLLLACTLVPLLAYAAWAALPRTHPGPFEWAMTEPALRVWVLMPLVYLGAFASGIRPARWFGSRLLPLAAATLPATVAYLVNSWWAIGFPLVVLGAAVLASDILWEAATRDY